jgi:cytochrome c oxidase subunit 4
MANLGHGVDAAQGQPANLSGDMGSVAHAPGQQHPVRLYLLVWAWLFVLSACSYSVDYFGFTHTLRWALILLFMVLKAGLIVAVFMHMAWERLALVYAILLPLAAIIVFLAMMVFEANYTQLTRMIFFRTNF